MATSLQMANAVSTTAQSVTDQNGKTTPLTLSTDKVGIGTNRPENRLHVGSGSTSIHPSRVNAVVASNSPDAGVAIAQNSGVNVLLQASGAGGYLGTTSNHPLVLRTNDSDRVVVDTNGNVHVTGDIMLANADCAEDFDIAETEPVEPGTVMVVGEEGVLHESRQAYDKCVAGVVSGAGNYKPGIVLDKQQAPSSRKPIALLGKVYSKVDASYAPIEVGDLLTTSPPPGHAMKANDPLKAFGAVIGKALRPLAAGQGLIPILIALQ
jgi:hypothetical protein